MKKQITDVREAADLLTKLEGKLTSVRLACREVGHDAIYQIDLVRRRGGWQTLYTFGARTGRIKQGTHRDTRQPLARWVAERALRKLALSKMRPGRDRQYQLIGVN